MVPNSFQDVKSGCQSKYQNIKGTLTEQYLNTSSQPEFTISLLMVGIIQAELADLMFYKQTSTLNN